jgi:Ca-activated chloride channel homolog
MNFLQLLIPLFVQFQISVNVDLVLLNVNVHNPIGQQVSNLSASSFTIHENGQLQTIRLFENRDIPATIAIVVDHSGSMSRKLDAVVAASVSFLNASNALDQISIVNFNDRPTLALSLTRNLPRLEAAIRDAATEGKTALYDALMLSLRHLPSGTRDRVAILLISDGADNASTHTIEQVLTLAEQSTATIHAIGLFTEADPDAKPGILRRIAHTTGGEAYFPRHLSDLDAICQRIALDIRNQYTIGYLSSSVSTSFRKIRVTAKSPTEPKLIVRTRPGYLK